jgi:hypothetical protein
VEQLFAQYGFWALMSYIVIRDGIPLLNKYFPFLDKQRERKMQQQVEELDRRHELREREVVVVEMIGKQLTVSNTRLERLEVGQRSIIDALIKANQGIAVLLDRVDVKRAPKAGD